MKIIITFLAILFLGIYSNSQVTQQWAQRYNSPTNYFDYGMQAAVDFSGNVYVTGWGYSGSSSTTYNCITVKYNSSGVQQWAVIFNGPANGADDGRAIAVDNSGNVYVTGQVTMSGTTGDILLIKYNTNGVQQWLQTYNGTGNGNDWANSIKLDASGNIYISGATTGSGTGNDYIALKYNSAGNLQWLGTYNGTGNGSDYTDALAVDPSGNVYVTGISKGPTLYGDYATVKFNSSGVFQWAQRYNGPGNGFDEGYGICVDTSYNVYMTGYTAGSGTGSDITTIKYNAAGVQQWLRTYDGTAVNNDGAYGMSIDSIGNIIVAGFSTGIGAGRDYITIKYSPAGIEQWTARYNGPGNGSDFINAVAVDNTGNIYVTGQSYVNNFVYDDYTTIKYNPAGVQQWVIRYNGTGNSGDGARHVTIDVTGNVFVTGWSWGTSTTNWDIATIKYSQLVGIKIISNQMPEKFSLSQNYPNPFNPATKIKFEIARTPLNPPFVKGGEVRSRGFITLVIYDVLGREITTLVNEQLQPGTYEVEWPACRNGSSGRNASTYPSGVYFYKLQAGNYSETKKMLMIK